VGRREGDAGAVPSGDGVDREVSRDQTTPRLSRSHASAINGSATNNPSVRSPKTAAGRRKVDRNICTQSSVAPGAFPATSGPGRKNRHGGPAADIGEGLLECRFLGAAPDGEPARVYAKTFAALHDMRDVHRSSREDRTGPLTRGFGTMSVAP
jgi:hypothetical protein